MERRQTNEKDSWHLGHEHASYGGVTLVFLDPSPNIPRGQRWKKILKSQQRNTLKIFPEKFKICPEKYANNNYI